MNIRPLLLLPLLLLTAACNGPPEITAASRKEAMDKCLADSREALIKINDDRKRAAANPELADFDTNPNYFKEFEYFSLIDDEYSTIEITQIYCVPRKNKGFKGYWYNLGYVEYLVRPTDLSFDVETKVDRMLVSYGNNWKE